MTILTLIQGDCLKVMRKIPDNSIDLVLTDPPYNVIGKTQKWDDKGQVDKFMCFTKDWLNECYRILKENTACYVFFGQKYIKEFYKLKTKFDIKRMLIWHHPNLAKPTRSVYLWTYDPIFYLVKGTPKFDANFSQQENVDVFRYPKPQSNFNKERRYHPTSKPLNLIKKLISPTTNEKDMVLDPFLGSGTTMKACLELNRNCIGVEIEPKYIQIAKKRLNWNSSLGSVKFEFYMEEDFEWVKEND